MCNKCDTIVRIFKDAAKVTVLADCCEECESQLMKVRTFINYFFKLEF